MPIKLDISAISRRRSAKFTFAMLVKIVPSPGRGLRITLTAISGEDSYSRG
jgi:hypothetical protein